MRPSFRSLIGVLLRPLVYPRPAQLMFLSTQFPALGFPQFWVSVPEYLEFQQYSRSFAEVGAFRTGESNLVVAERAVRVHSASVDAHLLNALGVQPARDVSFARRTASSPRRRPGRQRCRSASALDFLRVMAVCVRRARSGRGARRGGRPPDRDHRRDGARHRSQDNHTGSGCRSGSPTTNAARATITIFTSSGV